MIARIRRIRALLPAIVGLIGFLALSGCFVATAQYRDSVVSGLAPSTWPVVSGVWSRTSVSTGKTEADYGTFRRKRVGGQRVYVVDGKPGEFYAFYPVTDNAFIVEHYTSGKEWASAFTYAVVDPGGNAVGSFDNDCSDLTETQRKTLFGKSDTLACAIRSAHGSLSDLGLGGLVDMLNLSMKGKDNFGSVYRLQREVPDALE
jgi:hypothetical protein